MTAHIKMVKLNPVWSDSKNQKEARALLKTFALIQRDVDGAMSDIHTILERSTEKDIVTEIVAAMERIRMLSLRMQQVQSELTSMYKL